MKVKVPSFFWVNTLRTVKLRAKSLDGDVFRCSVRPCAGSELPFFPSTKAKLPPKAKKNYSTKITIYVSFRGQNTESILIISQNEHPLYSVLPRSRAFNRSLSDSPDYCVMHFNAVSQHRLLSVRRGDPTLATRDSAASSVVNQSHTLGPRLFR